ncbi:MAG: hypothetical protein AAGA34_00880 [Pseudomonadota bacterium]
MTRRLLAILALLSGLAALHAPAHASRLDQLSHEVPALSQVLKGQGVAACQCERPPQRRKRNCSQNKAASTRPRLLGALPPSLVIGADRALE